MNKTCKAFIKLSSIKPFTLRYNPANIEVKNKISETVQYAVSMDPTRSVSDVIEVTMPSILAEYHIAEYMKGCVNTGEEDLDEPMSYAFDVLSGPEYYGTRIEVKCSFSGKWIDVCGYKYGGTKGINLGSFCTHKVADLIIILSVVKDSPGCYTFTPRVISDHTSFEPEFKFVLKSGYKDSYYLNTKNYPKNLNLIVYN